MCTDNLVAEIPVPDEFLGIVFEKKKVGQTTPQALATNPALTTQLQTPSFTFTLRVVICERGVGAGFVI